MPMTEQDILRSELRWGAVVAGAVAVIIAVIVISSAAQVLHPPSNVETIDPTSLQVRGEFVEGNLGAIENPDRSRSALSRRNSLSCRDVSPCQPGGP